MKISKVAVILFVRSMAEDSLLELPGSAALISNNEELNMFEHAVNVTTFDPVPIYGG